jgi:hypothetical protein
VDANVASGPAGGRIGRRCTGHDRRSRVPPWGCVGGTPVSCRPGVEPYDTPSRHVSAGHGIHDRRVDLPRIFHRPHQERGPDVGKRHAPWCSAHGGRRRICLDTVYLRRLDLGRQCGESDSPVRLPHHLCGAPLDAAAIHRGGRGHYCGQCSGCLGAGLRRRSGRWPRGRQHLWHGRRRTDVAPPGPYRRARPAELSLHRREDRNLVCHRDDGVLTGYDANGRAWVYVTRDGGLRWQSADLTVPRSLAGNPITFGPAVFYGRRGHGVLVASNFAGVTVIYQTTDAGMHWALAGDVPGPVDRTVDVASARNMWATVNVSRTEQPDDVLYRSRDGGRTWRRVQGTLPPLLLELDFVSGRLGFASTAGGLWKTTDGGKLWIKLLPAIRPSVRGRRLGRSSPPEAHRGRQLLALTCEPVRSNRGNVPRQRGIRASALRGFCTGGTRSQIWLPGSAPRGPLHPGG